MSHDPSHWALGLGHSLDFGKLSSSLSLRAEGSRAVIGTWSLVIPEGLPVRTYPLHTDSPAGMGDSPIRHSFAGIVAATGCADSCGVPTMMTVARVNPTVT